MQRHPYPTPELEERSLFDLMTSPATSAEVHHKQMLHKRDVRRKIEDLKDQSRYIADLW
ncbi:hypothetical protein [Chitinimonas arctica]|uniref:hypothetical protein n=1 Tax=Chitinimonas arctica TaxID=2594795 RepID=UPI0015D41BD8|nr:hypothetical protein [Chitinimonas arctica]